jgi:Regulator of ribonuclease activity B
MRFLDRIRNKGAPKTSQEADTLALRQLAGRGADLSKPQWSLRAEGQRIVGAETIAAFRAWFERIAAEHGGEYDGWEAAAKP